MSKQAGPVVNQLMQREHAGVISRYQPVQATQIAVYIAAAAIVKSATLHPQ